MKIFLTGGSGYIGQETIAELVRQGHVVEALARSDGAAEIVASRGAQSVTGTLSDLDVLTESARNADAVIHLAQADTGDADLAAANAMLDGAGSGTYVHTGGTWVYGDTDGIGDETSPWHPPALVAWRQAVEQRVLARAQDGGRPVIVQPGLIYDGQNRLIDEFFTRPGVDAGAIPYIGDGTNHWALVHVDDLADLYVKALDARPGSVYVGTGSAMPTAKEVASAVSTGAGLDGRTRSITLEEARAQMGPIADAFALDQQLSSIKARAELNWTPAHGNPLAEFAVASRPAETGR
jgi:nucleoside-diphosphate-sugar epimerase